MCVSRCHMREESVFLLTNADSNNKSAFLASTSIIIVVREHEMTQVIEDRYHIIIIYSQQVPLRTNIQLYIILII